MRVLIVDGHSVIFAWEEVRKLHAQRTALAREELVKRLTAYADYSGIHLVVVFDGKGERANEATEPGGIQIFYSGANQTADDIIERLTASYSGRHDITVATDDQLEQETVVAFGAQAISSERLRDLLAEATRDFANDLKKHRSR